jgi:hypothetical protein
MRIRAILLSAILFLVLHQVSFAGDTISDSRKISTFTVLKINGNFNVVLIPGSECSLKVNGEKTTVAATQSKNMGVTLTILMDAAEKGTATLYITLKDINQVTINGTCKVSCTKQIKADDISLNLDGNTQGALDIKTKVITFTCNTDKDFVLKGKADKCTAKVEGDGAIDMSEMKVDDMNIDFSSDTGIKIYAHPDLHVKMSGAGNLTYYGSPKVKIFKVNGTGQPIEQK